VPRRSLQTSASSAMRRNRSGKSPFRFRSVWLKTARLLKSAPPPMCGSQSRRCGSQTASFAALGAKRTTRFPSCRTSGGLEIIFEKLTVPPLLEHEVQVDAPLRGYARALVSTWRIVDRPACGVVLCRYPSHSRRRGSTIGRSEILPFVTQPSRPPFSNQSPPSWEVKPWGSSRSGSHRTVTVVIVRTDGVAET
jgi:hypothetical protein